MGGDSYDGCVLALVRGLRWSVAAVLVLSRPGVAPRLGRVSRAPSSNFPMVECVCIIFAAVSSTWPPRCKYESVRSGRRLPGRGQLKRRERPFLTRCRPHPHRDKNGCWSEWRIFCDTSHGLLAVCRQARSRRPASVDCLACGCRCCCDRLLMAGEGGRLASMEAAQLGLFCVALILCRCGGLGRLRRRQDDARRATRLTQNGLGAMRACV